MDITALGGKAYEITTYSDAQLGIDGGFKTASCTTMEYPHSWWAVDIGQPKIVFAVNVTNDTNDHYC